MRLSTRCRKVSANECIPSAYTRRRNDSSRDTVSPALPVEAAFLRLPRKNHYAAGYTPSARRCTTLRKYLPAMIRFDELWHTAKLAKFLWPMIRYAKKIFFFLIREDTLFQGSSSFGFFHIYSRDKRFSSWTLAYASNLALPDRDNAFLRSFCSVKWRQSSATRNVMFPCKRENSSA